MSKRFLFAGVGAMGMTGGYYWFQKNSEEVVVIIGGGAMGTATAWSLSKRGHSCLLIDDGNPFKSSWGESRIVRETQTDPTLQLLMRRALSLWKEVGSDEFLHQTSIIALLDKNSKSSGDQIRACNDLVGAAYTDMTREDIENKVQLKVPKGTSGIHQEGGWAIDAQLAIEKMRDSAIATGAKFIDNDKVTAINRNNKTIQLESGKVLPFTKLVLCCGPKTNSILQTANLSLMNIVTTAEQQNYFLEKDGNHGSSHSVSNMPIVINVTGDHIYLIPHMKDGVAGVKVSQHHIGPVVSNAEEGYLLPPHFDLKKYNEEFRIDSAEKVIVNELPLGRSEPSTSVVSKWVAEYVPGLDPRPHYTYRCCYTSSIKHDGPLLGPHPDDANVILCAAFAGEGFKFAPAYGEAAANYAIGEQQVVDGVKSYDPARLAV